MKEYVRVTGLGINSISLQAKKQYRHCLAEGSEWKATAAGWRDLAVLEGGSLGSAILDVSAALILFIQTCHPPTPTPHPLHDNSFSLSIYQSIYLSVSLSPLSSDEYPVRAYR